MSAREPQRLLRECRRLTLAAAVAMMALLVVAGATDRVDDARGGPHLIGVAFHGRYKGQKQRWFLMRFTGRDNDIDLYAHEPEFSDWKWFDLDEIPGLIVPFKRPTYEAVIAGFRALVQPR